MGKGSPKSKPTWGKNKMKRGTDRPTYGKREGLKKGMKKWGKRGIEEIP